MVLQICCNILPPNLFPQPPLCLLLRPPPHPLHLFMLLVRPLLLRYSQQLVRAEAYSIAVAKPITSI